MAETTEWEKGFSANSKYIESIDFGRRRRSVSPASSVPVTEGGRRLFSSLPMIGPVCPPVRGWKEGRRGTVETAE